MSYAAMGVQTTFQALGKANEGMTAYNKGKQEAKLLKRQAMYTRVRGEEEAQDIEQATISAASTQRAQYGASGVKMEGSPLEVMLNTELEGATAAKRTRFWANVQAWELMKAGKMAKKAGGYAALGSLFSGIAQAASTWSGMGGGGGGSMMGGGGGG